MFNIVIIGEMQIKITISPHTSQNGYHKNKKKNPQTKRWQGSGEKGTLVQCWWECKLMQPLGGQYGVSTKT